MLRRYRIRWHLPRRSRPGLCARIPSRSSHPTGSGDRRSCRAGSTRGETRPRRLRRLLRRRPPGADGRGVGALRAGVDLPAGHHHAGGAHVAEAGDHIVSSPSLYGGTYNLFHYTLPKFGIEVTFVEDPSDPESWRKAVKPNTKAFFGETIANPKNEILDIKTVADIAHEVGVPLIVDNTVATPYLIKPIDFGADVVIHSATKFLSGHGNAVVGAIVDAGRFDYAQYPEKFKGFNEPDPSYNGIVYSQALGVGSAFGANLSYIFKIRLQLLRDVGAAVAPFNAWLLAQGLETLSLRIERHIENAKAIATWLEAHPSVSKVNYASLTSSPWNQLAKKYAPKGSGAVLSFELKGGVEAGKKFVESLKLFSHVANIGDVRSLVIHPATTTHSQLSAEEQLAAGVTPGLVRLSLGLENIDDLKADLEIGFAAAK